MGEGAARRGDFATTRWSLVAAAGDAHAASAHEALATLCGTYWQPLYAFARRSGADAHAAEDLVQGFFATLIEKRYLDDADRERGRFRAFLVTAFRHYTSKERERARALKRGGRRRPLALDFDDGERRYLAEPVDTETPERLFERRWARTVLDRALARLRDELRTSGREAWFDALLPHVVGGAGPQRETAERLGMTEGALKVAVHRLRGRYRDALRAEVADTVRDPGDVDDELRLLVAAI